MGENKSRSFLQLLDHGEENAIILMCLGKRTFPFIVSLRVVRPPVLGTLGDCHGSVKPTVLGERTQQQSESPPIG